jgi:hypothetical protein
MTGKADFSQEDWELVLEGPPLAGMVVASAASGGTFRESFAIARAYADARSQHGESELLDEIVSAKPKVEHERFHSFDELEAHALDQLGKATAVLEAKATPEELERYKRFVLDVAQRVAAAHSEHGTRVSPEEQAAIDGIAARLGVAAQG